MATGVAIGSAAIQGTQPDRYMHIRFSMIAHFLRCPHTGTHTLSAYIDRLNLNLDPDPNPILNRDA